MIDRSRISHLGAEDRSGLWGVLGDLADCRSGLSHRGVHAPLDQGAVVNVPNLCRCLERLGVSGAREQSDVAAQNIEALDRPILRLLVELAREVSKVILQRTERQQPVF